MMKKFSLIFMVLVLILTAAAGCGGSSDSKSAPAATGPKTFQLGHILSDKPDDPYQILAVNFSNNVKEMSKGSLKVDVVPNAQLGGERDMIEGMQLGTIQMALLTNVNVGSFRPKFMVFDLPFIFPDAATAHKVLDGATGRKVLDSFDEIGVKGLAWGEGGFRHMINKVRPIKEPGDVKGLKFRSLENPLYIDTYKSLGTNPTPMAWTETFTGMQQGTIDGLDIPISVIYSNRFYEVAKYLSLTNHFYSPLMLTVSKKVWDKLTPEEQKILMDAAKKAGDDERKFVQQSEKKFIDEMTAKGMNINSDVKYPAFQEAVKPLYEKYKEKVGADLLNEVLNSAKK